jgi:hypothetical protein
MRDGRKFSVRQKACELPVDDSKYLEGILTGENQNRNTQSLDLSLDKLGKGLEDRAAALKK